MFTGIIEWQGQVVSNNVQGHARRLIIQTPIQSPVTGESISVNGVCLTLLPDCREYCVFDVSPETLSITTLGDLKPGDCVNLERAMLATSRFGGHYVSGHIDTSAAIKTRKDLGEYLQMVVGGFSECDMMYLLPKGSITLDGVSLTINTVFDDALEVMLVPHTLACTTLGQKQVGQRLNVEFDYMTRIVAHQLNTMLPAKIAAGV